MEFIDPVEIRLLNNDAHKIENLINKQSCEYYSPEDETCCERFYYNKMSVACYYSKLKLAKKGIDSRINELVVGMFDEKIMELVNEKIKEIFNAKTEEISKIVITKINEKFEKDEKIKKYSQRMNEFIQKRISIFEKEIEEIFTKETTEIDNLSKCMVEGTKLIKFELNTYLDLSIQKLEQKNQELIEKTNLLIKENEELKIRNETLHEELIKKLDIEDKELKEKVKEVYINTDKIEEKMNEKRKKIKDKKIKTKQKIENLKEKINDSNCKLNGLNKIIIKQEKKIQEIVNKEKLINQKNNELIQQLNDKHRGQIKQIRNFVNNQSTENWHFRKKVFEYLNISKIKNQELGDEIFNEIISELESESKNIEETKRNPLLTSIITDIDGSMF